MAAQQLTEYNIEGDKAMKKRDYSDARLYYAEGVANCDMYSISQLTKIWMDNIDLHSSLYNLMGRCLSCLNNNAARNDTTAMSQLVAYYSEGIGTTRSENMSRYWAAELEKSRKPAIDSQPSYTGPKEMKQPIRFFGGYVFSALSPIGITVGGIGNRFGLYGRFKTNASFQSYEGEITYYSKERQEGFPDGGLYEYSERNFNMLAATAGLVVRANDFFLMSIGAGYFKYDWIYRYSEVDDSGNIIKDHRNFKVANYSSRGIAIEVDGILEIGKLYVTAGVSAGFNTQNFKYVDLNAGFGMFF
ncbi:hypothetical protein FACS1894181_09240 [Bacteroidia bacterium]|nr:hypothetical protein FACS1894181_09240 [Bacteroidia bacterium]